MTTDTKDRDELTELAQNIKTWKESRPESERMTNSRLIQLYPALGSDKTLLALASGDAVDRNVKRWLSNYRQVWHSISSGLIPNMTGDAILELSNVLAVTPVVNSTIVRNSGVDRLIVIEGTSGAGKTWALRRIKQELTGAVYLMDADDTWRSARVAAGEMLKALGDKDKDIPASMAQRQSRLISKLQRKVVLLIDEGHHGGSGFLSLIKTILNRTQAVVVLAAMDTLWRKLTHEASEEARQLLHNRLAERIFLQVPTTEDARLFFAEFGKLSAKVAGQLVAESSKNGHLSFFRRVREMVRENMTEEDDLNEFMPAALAWAKSQMGIAS